ncbi:MAG: adenylate/guanylate cyclase domain-containing protein [Ectothiorhodospiraceae bacterium]|nr:adenylate/guanylate cyclase domain-containing protein [Chromatiales bacterium]MCP5156798.1 adenylate/guanylate cyclase domain-containing protein [Ectothiorhodospiraceae bacterium]
MGRQAALDTVRNHAAQIAVLGAVLVAVVAGVGRLPWSGAAGLLDQLGAGAAHAVVIAATGVALAVLLPVLAPIRASLLTLAAAAVVGWSSYLSAHPVERMPLQTGLGVVLVLFVTNVLYSYFAETRRKQRLVEIFGQYVPAELASSLGNDPGRVRLDGESRDMSVMFCDIHDFTSIAERLEPRELVLLLNAVFSTLSRIIYRHKGIIDKYLGDGVMAFWGAPVPDSSHAANAVSAAFEMQDALARLRVEFLARGWPEVHMGIGINSGTMAVGNMGSPQRIAYTVVGDAVNLAARLEELTRIYRTRIIVGEGTRRGFPAVTYRELGLVQVKGKNRLERIFEPCNPATDPASTIVGSMHRHNEALHCYQSRMWDQAESQFRALKEANPGDPLYDYYLARIAEYRRAPPPRGWRGEIRYSVG